MAQTTSGVHAALSHPRVYDVVQALFGAARNRRWLQQEFIRAQPGERVLDVGCGTADILSVLPDGIEYVGVDISESYIRSARARWGDRGQFHAGVIDRQILAPYGAFDLMLMTGVLHHLGDAEVQALCETLSPSLKPDGRIVSIDACYVDGQNPIARFLIDRDRGHNVRTPDAYEALVRPAMGDVKGWLVHQRWVPYTYWIMQAGAPAAIE